MRRQGAFVFAVAVGVLLSAPLISFSTAGSTASQNTPGPPINLRAVPGPDYAVLSWNPPSNVVDNPLTGFMIFRQIGVAPDAQGYGTDPTIATVGAGARNFTIIGLNPLDTYVYYMRSVNGVIRSGPSDWVWVVPGRSVPGPPMIVTIVGNDKITLHGDFGDQGGCAVEAIRFYRGNSSDNLTLLAESPLYEYIDNTAQNGVWTYYAATAINAAGEGGFSGAVRVRALWAPTNVTASPDYVNTVETVTIRVNWSFPASLESEISGFRVLSQRNQLYVDVDKDTRTAMVNASGGWIYDFYVIAVYPDGQSYSAPAHVMAPMSGGVASDNGVYIVAVASIAAAAAIAIVAIDVRRRNRTR